jgi:hypothetical protein
MYPKEYQALVELESKCEEISKKIVEEGGKCDEEKEKERLENLSKLNLSQLSAESQRSLSERVYRKLMPMDVLQSGFQREKSHHYNRFFFGVRHRDLHTTFEEEAV